MPKPTRRSLGRIVLVILGVVIIGLLIYHFWPLMTQKTSRIDILKVEKLIVDEGTFETLKGEKVETEKLSAGRAEIQEAKIQKAEIQRAEIQKAKIQKAEIEECLEECATPKSTCENECSYVGQRRCAPGCIDQNQYQICGNYDADSCLEWSQRYTCPVGKICRTGYCVSRCTSHHHKACYNNDVYWYDSCNRREGKYQECGQDYWTDNYRCAGNWVQREKREKGCSGTACYEYSRWQNCQNCAAENRVCRNGQCVAECISHYTKKCYNNDVYWYDSCNRREEKYQECGSDSYGQWGARYCVNNKVYQKMSYHYRGCSVGQCYDNFYEREKLVEMCDTDEICQAGICVFVGGCSPGGPGPDSP